MSRKHEGSSARHPTVDRSSRARPAFVLQTRAMPRSGVAARSMLPAPMTARPAVAAAATSASVLTVVRIHPANMSWRRTPQSYVLTPVIPCTPGSVPVEIVASDGRVAGRTLTCA